MRLRLTKLLALLLLVGCVSIRCTNRTPTSPVRTTAIAPTSATPLVTRTMPSVLARSESTIVVLLADNHLITLRATDGMILASYAFAAPPDAPNPGQYLALSRDHRTLYALIPGTPDRLLTLDVATATTHATYALEANSRFSSVRVGPTTGRLYLFGNHPGGVVMQVMDPLTGTVFARWDFALGNYDWHILQAELSVDERTFYLSYHGTDTTGIDRFIVTPTRVQRCEGQPRANVGCIAAHGPFALDGATVLFQRGDSTVIVGADPLGQPQRQYDTGLIGNHMVALTVDVQDHRLYAVGSCGYRAGFAALDLVTGVAPILAEPPPLPPQPLPPLPCGERLALGSGSWVAVARVGLAVPDAQLPGAILLVDLRIGETIQTFPTSSEPRDVLVVPVP